MLFHQNKIVHIHRFVDLALSALAFLTAYLIRKYLLVFEQSGKSLAEEGDYFAVLILILTIWKIGFALSDIHSRYYKFSLKENVWPLIQVISACALVLAISFYFFKLRYISRAFFGVFYFLDIALLLVSAHVVYRVRRLGAMSNLLVVIIGSREAAREFIDSILDDPDSCCKVLGCLEVSRDDVGKVVTNNVKVIGTVDELQHFLTQQVIDELIFAAPIDRIWEAEKYLAIAECVGVNIRILLHWHLRKFLALRPKFYSMQFEGFFEKPTLFLRPKFSMQSTLMIKTCFDFVFAAIALLLTLPLFALIALAIKIASPGPVFYTQVRCGLYGRKFTFYKFRTMVVGADKMQQSLEVMNEADGVAFKIKKDPRIIPYIGSFLRKTSLDELPNLINVIRGDMSIVGPRPPVPGEVERYQLWERRRLSMKPGITCIWQVAPMRNDVLFEQWMKMDLEYIDNWSLWLDARLLAKTLRAVFFGYGA